LTMLYLPLFLVVVIDYVIPTIISSGCHCITTTSWN